MVLLNQYLIGVVSVEVVVEIIEGKESIPVHDKTSHLMQSVFKICEQSQLQLCTPSVIQYFFFLSIYAKCFRQAFNRDLVENENVSGG